MVGEFDDPSIRGIIPRTFDYIFDRLKQIQKEDPSSKYSINIAFIQIYLETIQDLFEPNNQVKIREDPDKGVFLENCLWIKVKNTNDCEIAFKKGEKNRITECTKMNAHSSRSHALLIVKIERNFIDEDSNEHIMTQGFLYLVDLAGSERVTKTNAREMRLEEAKKINYSLLILGNCIQSLTSPNPKYVSYRDSKLTRILQESLGGNAKTSLIVTISPSNYNCEETLSSLNFGLRAMKVQNKPIINRAQDYQAMCFKLQEEYDKLMEQYSKLRIEYDKVCDENEKLKNGEMFLNMQKNNIKQQIKNNKYEKYISNEDLERIKKKFEKDMANLESYYNEVMKNKEEENIKIMKEIDNTLIKKDNEIQNLYNKLNEYEYKIKNITEANNDINNEVEDLKKTCNDMLLEKEQLNSRINQLIVSKQNLTNNINILNKKIEDKKNSLVEKQTQTNPIINPKIKDLLFKHKISEEDINKNNFSKIITQLIIGMETLYNDQITNNGKIKKLNESIAIITKNYEDKLEKVNKENIQLKNNIISLNKEKEFINDEKNKYRIEKENQLLDCKNKIDSLEIRVKQINEDKKNFNQIKLEYEKKLEKANKENAQLKNNIISLNNEKELIYNENNNYRNEKENQLLECKDKIDSLEIRVKQINEDKNNFNQIKLEYEKEINDLRNDNKIMNMNYQTIDSELKVLKNSYLNNEKNLNKIMTQLYNDNNLLNQYKKQLKKIDTLIDNDLINVNNNNFEYNINKAKTEGNKLQLILEDINNNNSNNLSNNNLSLISNPEIANSNRSFKNINMNEIINKINENNQENKNNLINFINMISKLYIKYIDLYNKYNHSSSEYEKNNEIKNKQNIKNEENLKNNIISVANENIDKYASMCYNNNINDLKEELNSLNIKSNKMKSFDVLKAALDILEKLLLRITSFKNEKELEIENLNGKIIYLLSELDIYKKNWNLNKDNNNKNELQLINNQLGLKDNEINRLNKDIDDYLVKINELTCENNLLKNNKEMIKSNNNNNDNIFFFFINNYNNNYYNENKNTNYNNYYPIHNNNINNIHNQNNENYDINNNINNLHYYDNDNKNSDENDNDNDNDNNNDKNENDNFMTDEEIKKNMAKNQSDIDKIKLQLKELNNTED